MIASPAQAGREDGALWRLFRAIAAGDAKTASRILAVSPQLAQDSTPVGASRGSPTPFYLEEIEHYIYARDTALHVAAAAYRTDIAKVLLANGADPAARNRRGAQALTLMRRTTTECRLCIVPYVRGVRPRSPFSWPTVLIRVARVAADRHRFTCPFRIPGAEAADLPRHERSRSRSFDCSCSMVLARATRMIVASQLPSASGPNGSGTSFMASRVALIDYSIYTAGDTDEVAHLLGEVFAYGDPLAMAVGIRHRSSRPSSGCCAREPRHNISSGSTASLNARDGPISTTGSATERTSRRLAIRAARC